MLGLPSGTLGQDILTSGQEQLSQQYPEVEQIEKEKVLSVQEASGMYRIQTNKNEYITKIAVIALNYAKPFTIEGLDDYLESHQKANIKKDRIQLKNTDHLIKEGLYVCGTLAGWRSQFAIAAGSGASVATDILTIWNDGNHTKVHDKV